MIVALRKAGATVILAGMTLPPNYGPDYIRDFQKIYQDLAAKYHVTLIPFLMAGSAYLLALAAIQLLVPKLDPADIH